MARKSQKEHTKELLLQTAFTEFANHGIHNTKTIDIAKAAGVAHGTIFAHFPSREELILEVIQEFGLKIGHRLQALTAQKGSIRDVLLAHLQILQEYEPFYAQLLTERELLSPEARSKLFLIQSGIARYLHQSIQQEVDQDRIKKLPLHLLMNTWLGLVYYYLSNRDIFAPGQSVIKTRGGEILDYFLALVSI